MPMSDIERKKSLRRTLRARRREASARLGERAGHLLAERVLSQACPPMGTVLGAYWPMPGEMDVRPLLQALADRGGVTLALPVVVAAESPLIFRVWSPGDPMEDGALSTRQPLASAPLACPDWLLVPLLGFDRTGGRLGLGGGFYDRTLAALGEGRTPPPVTLGVAYSDQEVDLLPVEAHDHPLDAVVTERAIHRFGRAFPSSSQSPSPFPSPTEELE